MANDSNELSMRLKKEAVGLGLCEDWTNGWQDNSTQQELINKFKRGIDFCLQHHWPSADFIDRNFKRELLWANGINVHGFRSFRNPEMCIFMGDANSVIRLDNQCSHGSRIFLNDNTETQVFVHTNEKVIIETRGHAHVKIHPDMRYKCDIVVYDYSDDTLVEAPESVRYSKEKVDYTQV